MAICVQLAGIEAVCAGEKKFLEDALMANPAWFDAEFYATQKVAQMNAMKYQDRTDWDVTSYEAALNAFTPALAGAGTAEKAFTNFGACNTSGYVSSIGLEQINVSPNAFFDVDVYLQNLATYNNQNPDAYEKPAPEGGWTAQSILTEMKSGGYSAWQHYTDSGMALGIDPSNLFSTSKYLDARAAEMGNGATAADALKVIQDAGLNAIQDYYEYGQSHGITAAAPEVLTTVDVPAGWNHWTNSTGGGGEEADDPYANVTQTVTMTAAQTVYPGDGESYAGQNTLFDAQLPSDSNKVTLKATDQIDGGDGYNTLAINEFGRNWTGFRGVKVEGQDDLADNVVNVGRIQLNHTKANTEISYKFDAKYISDDTVRFDINNTGNGTIGLTNLSKAVTEVNISGLSATGTDVVAGTGKGTTLQWADKVLDGEADVLQLGLDGVGTQGEAKINAEGIEHLTVNTATGTTNNVDLAGFKDLTSLTVKGGGNLRISDVVNRGITSYDAEAATGDVNMAVGRLTNETVIKGSEGFTTVNLTNSSNTLTPTAWTSVEAIWLATGDSMSIDATNIPDLQQLQVWGNTARLTNVNATDFAINQNSKATSTIQVNGGPNGGIDNVTYATAQEITGKVSTDATQNISINLNTWGTGKNEVGADFKGTFTANSAAGDITLTVQEGDNVNAVMGNGTINATSAQTFTANIDGDLETGATFNVVGGEAAAGRTVTINAANIVKNETNAAELTLKADGATDVKMNLTGSLTLKDGSSLKGAENITIDVSKADDDIDTPTFDASMVSFDSAQKVTVDATEMKLTLGNLGSAKADGAIDASLTGKSVTVGDMQVDDGWNIKAVIDSVGDATLGKITAGTIDNANNEGNVNLTVITSKSSDTATDGDLRAPTAIIGDALNINFSDVVGTVSETALKADASINYIGNSNIDTVTVDHMGAGNSSFELGDGDDILTFNGLTSNGNVVIDLGKGKDILTIEANILAKNTMASIDVSCGGEKDVVDEINISSQKDAQLLVNISDTGGEVTLGTKATSYTAENAAAILESFGISGADAADIDVNTPNGFIYNDVLYAADADTDATVLYVFDDAGVTIS